jgi:hypothetical protein
MDFNSSLVYAVFSHISGSFYITVNGRIEQLEDVRTLPKNSLQFFIRCNYSLLESSASIIHEIFLSIKSFFLRYPKYNEKILLGVLGEYNKMPFGNIELDLTKYEEITSSQFVLCRLIGSSYERDLKISRK